MQMEQTGSKAASPVLREYRIRGERGSLAQVLQRERPKQTRTNKKGTLEGQQGKCSCGNIQLSDPEMPQHVRRY